MSEINCAVCGKTLLSAFAPCKHKGFVSQTLPNGRRNLLCLDCHEFEFQQPIEVIVDEWHYEKLLKELGREKFEEMCQQCDSELGRN